MTLAAYHYGYAAWVADRHDDKIESMRSEMQDVKMENQEYEEFLRTVPGSNPFYDNQIEELKLKMRQLRLKVDEQDIIEPPFPHFASAALLIGDTYSDAQNKITLKLISLNNDLQGNSSAVIELTLPDGKSYIFENVVANDKYEFVQNSRTYEVLFTDIDWNKALLFFRIKAS